MISYELTTTKRLTPVGLFLADRLIAVGAGDGRATHTLAARVFFVVPAWSCGEGGVLRGFLS